MNAPILNVESMLKALREEKASLESRLEQLEEREETLLEWLKEDQPAQTALPMQGGANGSTPLSSLLKSILGDGKPHMLDELSSAAYNRGLVEKGKTPGRVVHFALIGMQQHGYAERRADGAWIAGKP